MITTKTTKENRKRWIEKLYSGQYDQVKGVLHSPELGGYCCLGVACTIDDPTPEESVFACGNESLNEDGLRAFGLTEGEQDTLMHINDNKQMTFAEIGMYLEFCALGDVDLEEGMIEPEV